MSKTRNLSDLLDANGDVKSTALDNVPASNDASALTTGTLDNARLATNVSVSGDLTVDTDTLKVDSTNNRVGIGTTTPATGLHINSTSFPQQRITNAISFSMGVDGGNNLVFDPTSGSLRNIVFRNSGAGNIRVGLDTDAPLGLLHLKKASDTADIKIESSGGSGKLWTIGSRTDGSLQFYDSTGGSEIMRLTSSGLHLGGTGSANALDDYEEGTFTPTVGGAGSDPTVTFNARSGNYTKIGDRVFINLIVYTNSISGGSGNFNIRGLPFTSNARGTGSMIFDRMRIQASYQNEVTPYVEANTTYLAIAEMNDWIDEARTHIQIDDLASNVYIMLSAQYTTNS